MKKSINKIFKLAKTKVAQNTIWIIAERIFQMIISLIVGALSARYLGPSNYGLINYGTSIVTFFLSIAKLGLENIIIKEYIENKNKNGEIIGTALVMRIISSLISICLIYILVTILKPNEELVKIITLIQSISLIFQSYEIIDYWFQSRLDSKYVSISKSIAYTLVSVYKIFLLITKKTVIWFAVSTTIDYIVIFIILIIIYKKTCNQKISFSKNTAKKLLKKSYHFIISGMFVTLYMQMDKIMIGNYLSEYYVGLYSAATTICTLWSFIPEAIINSMRPTIYESKKNNEQNYLNKLRLLYCIIFWMGILFSIIITIFSKLIITILYGKNYLLAQSSLIIVVWYTAFAYLGSARGVWIVCEEKNRYSKKYIMIGAIINLLLNYLLIPRFGIEGAAIATLISQAVVAIFAPLLYKETRISTKYMLEGIIFKGVNINAKNFEKE